MLRKSGLMSFAKQIRIQLITMKYNAIRVVARKSLKHLYLVRGTKMTLKVCVLRKLLLILPRAAGGEALVRRQRSVPGIG